MTGREQSNSEQLSALFDGELELAETKESVSELLASSAQQQEFQRHAVISDVLRREYQPALSHEFVKSVSQAVKNEPTWELADDHIEAPQRPAPQTLTSDNIINFAAIKRKPMRAFASAAALAASVALAAIVVFSAGVGDGVRSVDEQVATVDATPAIADQPGRTLPSTENSVSPEMAELLARLAQQPKAEVQQVGIRWNTSQQVEQRLNNYLLNHSEYISTSPRGMMPYARIVGYERSERFQ